MGHVPSSIPAHCVWVHAVSVGEVIAAETFIKALKKRYPDINVVVSTITDTGQKVAGERLRGIADTVYMPFDLDFIMRNAIKALKPRLFVVMETELWPNAIWGMQSANVPVVMLNGRISDSSYKGYSKLKIFMKNVLRHVNIFCMQDEEYARRITDLGAPADRVKVTGSLKFDISLSGHRPEWGGFIKGPVIVAGSTHRGEEDLIVVAYDKLRADFGDLNLVIAPRHPERFDEVEKLLKDRSIKYVRRSKLNESEISGTVVLLDTIGELSGVYAIADIAVMGGSFIEHGGQNPLEPAYWGKPVVCGPHMENFPFIDEFYAHDAAVQTSGGSLYETLRGLISSREKRESMGRAAGELLKKNRGALDRALDVVEEYLKQ